MLKGIWYSKLSIINQKKGEGWVKPIPLFVYLPRCSGVLHGEVGDGLELGCEGRHGTVRLAVALLNINSRDMLIFFMLKIVANNQS